MASFDPFELRHARQLRSSRPQVAVICCLRPAGCSTKCWRRCGRRLAQPLRHRCSVAGRVRRMMSQPPRPHAAVAASATPGPSHWRCSAVSAIGSAATPTLMGLGAGIAGGRAQGEGLSRAQNAMSGRALDQQRAGQSQTVTALMNRGLSEDVARAAAGNPRCCARCSLNSMGSQCAHRRYRANEPT